MINSPSTSLLSVSEKKRRARGSTVNRIFSGRPGGRVTSISKVCQLNDETRHLV